MSEASGSIRRPDSRPSTDAGRFVPSGVDPQSWIGFEHRIQERRFRALLETIAAASSRGDGVSARIALEEARELRPDAPELEQAAERVALLPMAMAAAPSGRHFHSRAIGAFAMLFVGVALLLALDFARSGEPALPDTVATAPGPVLTPVVDVQPVEADPVDVDVIDAGAVAPAEEEEPVVTAPVVIEPEPRDTVGTAGARMAAALAPEPAPAPAPPVRERLEPEPVVVPTVTLADASADVPPVAEIPDDFVATQPRREAIVASPVVPPASRGPLLIRPRAVTEEPPVPAVTPASAAIAPVRQDETLVSSVLDRYARAYDALDASAAREVWPSVDERALARAFAGLQSQNVSFDDCSIDVRGEIANASCRGLASYVGKVGNREPRTEPRQWTFELRRDGEAWRIESARTTVMQ